MYWHGGMGPERACDSATGVPKYGNHLHIHLGPYTGMCMVWGLREPATVQQVKPYMEIICICSVGMGYGDQRACHTVREMGPYMEIICKWNTYLSPQIIRVSNKIAQACIVTPSYFSPELPPTHTTIKIPHETDDKVI